jgi:hypothetical protein
MSPEGLRMRSEIVIVGSSALLSILILLFTQIAYPITLPWNIREEWFIGPYWIMPEEEQPHIEPIPGPVPEPTPEPGPSLPPLFLPPEVLPPEAQWGSIALALIFSGAVIYYIRRPKSTQQLWKEATSSRVSYGPRKAPGKRKVKTKSSPKRKAQQKKQPKRRIHQKK